MSYELPTSLQIGEQSYHIRNNADYRMILDCFSCLEDAELTKEERIIGCLMIFYEDINDIEDVDAVFGDDVEEAVKRMFWFFNCEDEAIAHNHSNHVLVDWNKDSQIISAAINKVAGREIRTEPYIHWWTFMGYYMGIGECLFSTVIGIRDKIVNGKKLEKYESKFRNENPQYFIWNSKTVEQQEAEDWVKSVWNAS